MGTDRKVAIIAGSAGNLVDGKVKTYISKRRLVKVIDGTIEGKTVVFLPRHGLHHTIPPHKVKHEANISLFTKRLGVTDLVSISAVGSNNVKYPVGSFVLVSDFIGFAQDGLTLFNKFKKKTPMHTPMSEPYSPSLNAELVAAGKKAGIEILTGAVLLDVPGPRFETPAEIKIYKQWGADLMGMTSIGETILANEFRQSGHIIRNSTLCLVTNYTTGTAVSNGTSHDEVKDMAQKMEKSLKELLGNFVNTVLG